MRGRLALLQSTNGVPDDRAFQGSLMFIKFSLWAATAHIMMHNSAAKHTDDRDAARSCQVGRLLLKVLVLLQRPAVAEEGLRCCQLLEGQGYR